MTPTNGPRIAETKTASRRTTRSQANGFADRLRREHDLLAWQLARLDGAADAIGNAQLSLSALRAELESAYELWAGRILPHLRSADDYQRALAQRDYVSLPAHPEREEAERLAAKLGRLRDRVSGGNIADARLETRRLLHELHALTRPHFGAQRGPQA